MSIHRHSISIPHDVPLQQDGYHWNPYRKPSSNVWVWLKRMQPWTTRESKAINVANFVSRVDAFHGNLQHTITYCMVIIETHNTLSHIAWLSLKPMVFAQRSPSSLADLHWKHVQFSWSSLKTRKARSERRSFCDVPTEVQFFFGDHNTKTSFFVCASLSGWFFFVRQRKISLWETIDCFDQLNQSRP